MKSAASSIIFSVMVLFTALPAGAAENQTSLLIDRVLAAYGSGKDLGKIR